MTFEMETFPYIELLTQPWPLATVAVEIPATLSLHTAGTNHYTVAYKFFTRRISERTKWGEICRKQTTENDEVEVDDDDDEDR